MTDYAYCTKRLTDNLERMLLNKQAGVTFRESTLKDGRRVDLMVMEATFGVKPVKIYEVKVSRADFLRDMRSGKWKSYAAVGTLYFVMPCHVAMPDELPEGVGLIYYREFSEGSGVTARDRLEVGDRFEYLTPSFSFQTVKRPKKSEFMPDQHILKRMIFTLFRDKNALLKKVSSLEQALNRMIKAAPEQAERLGIKHQDGE